MCDSPVAIIASEPVATILDPNAKSFTYRDENLVHRGVLVPNLDIDWQIVQNLHEGDVGQLSGNNVETWQHSTSAQDSVSISHRRGVRISQHSLPFPTTGDALMSGFTIPAKPVMKVSSLQDRLVHMPFGTFIDKVLPPPSHSLITRERFDGDYFVSLHNIVSAAGMRGDGSVYPEYTPNHLGARIKLAHTGLKPDRWRYHLLGYEHAELVQFIEHGFPLGLGEQYSEPWFFVWLLYPRRQVRHGGADQRGFSGAIPEGSLVGQCRLPADDGTQEARLPPHSVRRNIWGELSQQRYS